MLFNLQHCLVVATRYEEQQIRRLASEM